MKKFLSLLLTICILIGCSACAIVPQGTGNTGGSGTQQPGNTPSQGEEVLTYEVHKVPSTIDQSAFNLIEDDKFQMGINVLSTASAENMRPQGSTVWGRQVQGYIDYEGTAKLKGADILLDALLHNEAMGRKRKWELTQWASKESLVDESTQLPKRVVKNGDNYTYSNDYKSLTVNPVKGSITLEANCGKEYNYLERSQAMIDGNLWTHFLLECYPRSVTMGEMKSLTAYIDFTINSLTNHNVSTPSGLAGAQAAQLVWYFVLRLKSGYGLWFGIPLFDNRELAKPFVPGQTVSWDLGTTSFIYTMAKNSIFDTPPQVGVNYKKTIPLESALKECYEFADKAGITKAGDSLASSRLDLMNFGYEIPGTIDISTTINQLGVYAVKA